MDEPKARLEQRAEDTLRRLEVLKRHLDDEGSYVKANTVHLAQELISELTGVETPLTAQPRDLTG